MNAKPPVERPLNIRHFAALAATVHHGSLTRAARSVNLTQPALTQAIAGLEAALGVTLFDRGPQGMAATPPALLMAPRVLMSVRARRPGFPTLHCIARWPICRWRWGSAWWIGGGHMCR